MAVVYTDTHAHLSYVAERSGEGAIERLAAAYSGTDGMIVDIGVDHDDFPGRKARFGSLPFVRLTAGIWPDGPAIADWRARVDELAVWVRDGACKAVGECGLDYHWMNGTPEAQARLFEAQAELAVAAGKPLIVHSRDAHRDTLRSVSAFSNKIPVIIHCFGYDEAACEEYVEAGCFVSFAGNVTYKKSEALRAACRAVPERLLLLETDSPYMNPEPLRGRDATPLDISRTYESVARYREVSVDRLAAAVSRNAMALFG